MGEARECCTCRWSYHKVGSSYTVCMYFATKKVPEWLEDSVPKVECALGAVCDAWKKR